MVNFKKIIVGILLISLVCTTALTVVFALSSEKYPASISACVAINKESANKAKQWIGSRFDASNKELKNQADSEKDSNKKLSLTDNLSKRGKIATSKFFSDHSDGSTSMKVRLPYVQVKIGNYTTMADENGEFYLEGLTEGEYPIVVSYNGFEIYKSTIKIGKLQASETFDITINRSESEFTKSAEKMLPPQSDSNNVQAQTITFQTYPVGSIVPWSKGKGTMYIAKATNIVGCNKADTASSDGSYSTSSFPWNNSDCAVSISNGLLYATSPLLFYSYYMDYYCVIEAMSSGDSKEQNIYCNGKSTMNDASHTSKGSHINCSWFTGVQHSEVLHAHN